MGQDEEQYHEMFNVSDKFPAITNNIHRTYLGDFLCHSKIVSPKYQTVVQTHKNINFTIIVILEGDQEFFFQTLTKKR